MSVAAALVPAFATGFVPPIALRPDAFDDLGVEAAALAPGGRAVLVIDRALAARGLADRAAALLAGAGLGALTYDAIAGEPGIDQVRAATRLAAGADIVIGIGGGSALDVAKIAAACARSDRDPLAYAGAAVPLPAAGLPKILVPTTAGTGAESSSTAVFAGPEGRKLWIWGQETKADRILLDPLLTVSLPPALTAACGLDAFVHAFEAATNRKTHEGAQLHAHAALRLIAAALPVAVAQPGALRARADMLLGACYAGIAIDACGTAIAHTVSHAMAGLAPIGHGLATALAFEVTLPWLVEAPTPAMEAAARACGRGSAAALPGFVTQLMDRCGVVRRLPAGFAGVSVAALAAEMCAPENAPMRLATARTANAADIERFAAQILALGIAA